jgi:hypothetical protein
VLERLPENLRTPDVARAVMSPSGILLAGAGASAAILAGVGLPVAAAVGALCWAGRVGLAVARRPRQERIDPFTLQEPWRSLVSRALSTERRFDDAVRQTSPGPLKDRLAEVAARVDAAVREAWAIAKRGHALDRAVRSLDITGVRQELAEAERGSRRTRRGVDQEATVRSLRSQLESAERLAGVAEEARSRLRRLNAQLDEAVARAIELSLSAADVAALQPLGSDVENLVSELESLRQALDDAGPGQAAAGW